MQYDLVKLHTLGIGQIVAFGGADRSIRAIANRETGQFSPPVILDQLVIFDFLGPDNFAVITSVLKLELHVFAGVGADLRRRRFGDRIGLGVGFEFRERKCKRAQDESGCDCERNSFHGLAPCLVVNSCRRTAPLGLSFKLYWSEPRKHVAVIYLFSAL